MSIVAVTLDDFLSATEHLDDGQKVQEPLVVLPPSAHALMEDLIALEQRIMAYQLRAMERIPEDASQAEIYGKGARFIIMDDIYAEEIGKRRQMGKTNAFKAMDDEILRSLLAMADIQMAQPPEEPHPVNNGTPKKRLPFYHHRRKY